MFSNDNYENHVLHNQNDIIYDKLAILYNLKENILNIYILNFDKKPSPCVNCMQLEMKH